MLNNPWFCLNKQQQTSYVHKDIIVQYLLSILIFCICRHSQVCFAKHFPPNRNSITVFILSHPTEQFHVQHWKSSTWQGFRTRQTFDGNKVTRRCQKRGEYRVLVREVNLSRTELSLHSFIQGMRGLGIRIWNLEIYF